MLYAMRKKGTKEYLTNCEEVVLNYNTEWFQDAFKYREEFKRLCYQDFELVEWIPKDNFYFVNEYFDIHHGCALVRMVDVTEHKTIENEQGYSDYAKNEFEEYLWGTVRKPQVNLISGSASYGYSTRTEEGYYSQITYIREGLDEQKQPIWLIDISTDSRDCDGRMEHHYFMKSKGGLKDLKQAAQEYVVNGYGYLKLSQAEIETHILDYMNEHSQEQYESKTQPSNHDKPYQRDYSAEAMGY